MNSNTLQQQLIQLIQKLNKYDLEILNDNLKNVQINKDNATAYQILVQEGGAVNIENHASQNVVDPTLKYSYPSHDEQGKLLPPTWIIQKAKEHADFFIYRHKETKKILDEIINFRTSSSEKIIALWGAEGFGKTSLAITICLIPKIIRLFEGKIFWIDMKEICDFEECATTLFNQSIRIEEISSSSPTNITDLTSLCQKGKRLIILDNLQNYEVFKKLLSIGNRNCCWLLTTNNKKSFSGRSPISIIHVPSFKVYETILMLYYSLYGKNDIEFEHLMGISEQLNEFPRLTSLIKEDINSKITSGYTIDEAIESILEGIKEQGWNISDEIKKETDRTFEKMLDSLNPREREKIKELIIFPANISIPILIISKLWDTSHIKTKRLCEKFYNLSLFREDSQSNKAISLDSVFREYLMQDNCLMSKRTNIHKKIADAYRDFTNEKSNLDEICQKISLEEFNYLESFYDYHYKKSIK